MQAIRDKAEALRAYMQQAGESIEMQHWCAEIKVRAERRAGELLQEMDVKAGRPTAKSSDDTRISRPTLQRIGISHDQSHRYQTIAALPEEAFEAHIATTKAEGQPLTSSGVYRRAKAARALATYPELNIPGMTPEGDGGPQVLLDGHNRLGICRQHDLPFRTVVIPLASRDEAVNWVIINQLGRRNLTPEQKSYLRGKRYNREKRQGERTDLTSPENQEKSATAERLAAEYSVSRDTIERDGQFAEAADTLEDEVRHDLRQAVLRRKSREDKTRTTKQQVTRAGRAIKERRVEPLPFMRRAKWKDHQVIEAIDLLAEAQLSAGEPQALVCALSRQARRSRGGWLCMSLGAEGRSCHHAAPSRRVRAAPCRRRVRR